MKPRLSAFASALCLGLVFAFAASQSAAASAFDLNYQGLTDNSSIDGNAIATGTSFELKIGFDTSFEEIGGQGLAGFEPTNVSLEIGGTPYTLTFPTENLIILADASNGDFPGINIPFFQSGFDGSAFFPGYLGTSTVGWSATDVTPTVFTDYIGAESDVLDLPTTAGPLVLDFNVDEGVNASITAVPEGSSITLLLLGMAALGLAFAMRRPGFATR
jgi:hypothetical protein